LALAAPDRDWGQTLRIKRIARALGARIGLNPWRVARRPAADVFDEWARDGRDAVMERAHHPVVMKILQAQSFKAGARYLDIGCGNGYAVRFMAARVPSETAVGLDASPEMVARARALSGNLTNVRFECAQFPAHALERGTFDVIFSMETMYYMTDLAAALREVRALLRPGGRFVSAIDFFEENVESHGWPSYVGAQMRLMSAREWRAAFQRAGFTSVVQSQLVVPLGEAVESWHATVGSLVTSGVAG
jgi:SAM-dependent methyltransferase